MNFTTYDHDQDLYENSNCASSYRSGNWYNYCTFSNLNGLYKDKGDSNYKNFHWFDFREVDSLKSAEMKFRPNY